MDNSNDAPTTRWNPLESLGKYWTRIIQCFLIWPDALADALAGSAVNQRFITAHTLDMRGKNTVKRRQNGTCDCDA